MNRSVHFRSRRRCISARVAWLASLVLLVEATTAHSVTGGVEIGPGWVHEEWTVEDGLPVNLLGRVLQADDGYLWVTTFDGLARFDGSRFTVFRTENVAALGSNRIIDMEQTGDGLLLRTATGALVRYDNGAFQAVELPSIDRDPNLTPFVHDERGLWVAGSNGVYLVSPSGQVAEQVRLPQGVRLLRFRRDAAARLWLGTSQGIATWKDGSLSWVHDASDVVAILPNGERMVFFRRDAPALEFAEGTWRSLTGDVAPGVKLFGTAVVRPRAGGGHFVLTGGFLVGAEEGRYEVLASTTANQLGRNLSVIGARGERWWVLENRVMRDDQLVYSLRDGIELRDIAIDHEGTLWLATDRDGLHALRPASVGVFGRDEGLPMENVYLVYEDRSENLWIGTHGEGLWRLSEGELTAVGRRLLDGPSRGSTRTTKFYPRAMAEDRDGTTWVGLLNGLYQIVDGELVATADREEVAIFQRVNALLVDSTNRLWVGTHAGLHTRTASASGGPPEWRVVHPELLSGIDIRTMIEGPEGSVWLGTAGGLIRVGGDLLFLDHESGLPSDLVRALHLDDLGVLWVGTENGGLARVESLGSASPDEFQVASFDVRHGLVSNGIHHILEDDLGSFWLSSNQGIFKVRRDQLEQVARGEIDRVESVAFTERDGMRNREANGGSRNVGLESRDGRLWFATQGGVAVIDPRSLAREPAVAPPPRIEQLRLGELARDLPDSGLELAPDQRTFSIEYTAVTLQAADRMRFRYRLKGYDDDWVDAGPRREAFFTRVPQGRYTFEVESRIAGQGWSGRTEQRPISVTPRLVETAWFRTLAASMTLLLLLAMLRLQARRQRQQRQRLEQMVVDRTAVIASQAEKLRELDRLKSDLFTNVSHEFRTPLTLTIGPLQDLLDGAHGDELSPAAARDIELALRNSHRVLDLINEILDLARLEAGQVRLAVDSVDLEPWLRRRTEAFVPMAERNGIDLSFDSLEEPEYLFFDAQQLAKVIDNLLANALNLTPSGGRVRVGIARTGADDVEVSIADTGPGIPAAQLPSIFDRFRQVDTAGPVRGGGRRRWPGTGIGLALAKEIVELHHGCLRVDSVEGQGATFTVALRRGTDHFGRDELLAGAESNAPWRTPKSDGRRAATETSRRAAPEVLDEHEQAADDRPLVLVAEDHQELRTYVRQQLEGHYRVIETTDGAEALEAARRSIPDLVVSDVMMPNMDGFELARALKNEPELSFVPVVLLTAKANLDSKLEGLGAGVDDYLTKPFDARELLARVRNLIENRNRLEEHLRVDDRFVLQIPAGDFQPSDQAFLERVRDVISGQMEDPDFGVEALASALGCDRTYLFRKLRELLDETPSSMLRELRLARAAEMLAARAGSVADVAYAVGFKSVSHFSQVFRRRYDTTPSAYAANVDPS